jgi:thiamine-monophosphate kinase
MRKSSRSVEDIGEFGVIDTVKALGSSAGSVIVGIGDDAAVVKPVGGGYELLTTDMLVENVHFSSDMKPEWIGRKALACSLSDIAAMGGEPRHALVSLGVPSGFSARAVRAMYRGMNRLADSCGVTIVGGDMVQCHELTISVALTGRVKKKHLVTRDGARPGDVICVSGPLGRSLLSGHHYRFTPRLKESSWLVRHCKPTSMIDISDGLAADLGHILKASGVGAELDESQLPLRRGASVEAALGDGEDFELCFTVKPGDFAKWKKLSTKPMAFYPVGVVTPDAGIVILIKTTGERVSIPLTGYTHF